MGWAITCSKSRVVIRESYDALCKAHSLLTAGRRSKTHLLTLYFLDSGSYYQGVLDWWGIFRATEYDYIRENQIDWFLQESCKSCRL